jgi:hypothetical protein
MATQVQIRRGSTTNHASFTGAPGEITVDTNKNTVVVHDGNTPGGFPLLNENNVGDTVQEKLVSGSNIKTINSGSLLGSGDISITPATIGSPTNSGSGATGTWSINISGVAATATALATTRSINGTNFNGTANILTAVWGTGRNFTIGNTTKAVDGAANVSFNLTEIGAAETAVVTPRTSNVGSAVLPTGTTAQRDVVPQTGYLRFNTTLNDLELYRGTDWLNFTLRTGTNGSSMIPTGTTAQRDATPSAGFFRYNTTLSRFEGFNGSVWGAVGGGATGGGADQVFYENDTTVTANHTINRNSHAVGPISVNSGVTVTIASGRRLVIL